MSAVGLGRLPADQFLGGEFTLDLERTRKIVQAWLKENRSNLTVEQFAAGVVRVVNANMEKAIRVVSIERGYDPGRLRGRFTAIVEADDDRRFGTGLHRQLKTRGRECHAGLRRWRKLELCDANR